MMTRVFLGAMMLAVSYATIPIKGYVGYARLRNQCPTKTTDEFHKYRRMQGYGVEAWMNKSIYQIHFEHGDIKNLSLYEQFEAQWILEKFEERGELFRMGGLDNEKSFELLFSKF